MDSDRLPTEQLAPQATKGINRAGMRPSWPALLTIFSLVCLAMAVLLPAYRDLVETQYELDCLRVKTTEAEAWIKANERLINDLPRDQVLAKRLARSQARWLPDNEVVVIDSTDDGPDSQLISVPHRLPPSRPDGPAVYLANIVTIPDVRRGMIVASAVAAMAAVSILLIRPAKRNGI